MLALASYSASLYAEEPNKKSLSASVPSKAFLEFLAELKEVKGELLSPIDMLETDINTMVADKGDLAIQLKGEKLKPIQDNQTIKQKKVQNTELKEEPQ